jgi:hypothetical protein
MLKLNTEWHIIGIHKDLYSLNKYPSARLTIEILIAELKICVLEFIHVGI